MRKLPWTFFTLILASVLLLALVSCGEVCQHRDADDDARCDKCGEAFTDGEDITPTTYTVSVDDSLAGAGTAIGCGTYNSGEAIVLSAEANLGYTFLGWYSADSLVCEDEEYSLIIDKNLEARFGIAPEMQGFSFSSNADGFVITELADKTISKLELPEYVTSIADDVLKDCEITEATVPVSVLSSLPRKILKGTLTKVTIIGSGEIPLRAFYNYDKLADVTIGDGVTAINKMAFYNCPSLTDLKMGNGVTLIGESAFDECKKLERFNLSNSIETIGTRAFRNCELINSIVLPAGTTRVLTDAFSGCKIEEATFPADLISSIPKTDLKKAIINGGKFIRDQAFLRVTTLETVIIESGVKTIGKQAFWGCTSLTSIAIPDSVTAVNGNAFEGCTSLNAVHITDIAAWCGIEFSRATDYGMSYESSYYYSSNPLCYANNLYLNGELVTELVIPSGVSAIKPFAFEGCESITDVTIGNDVTIIYELSFHLCTSLERVTVKNGVEAIFVYVFRGCSSLESIVIPDSVALLGRAFADCPNLTIYCEAQSKPDGWTSLWNDERPVVWGYTEEEN
ncbi:MAG: leucine-rich repeat domain-containing protein [Clostridia bacterium]|nr:leucine-rich repeat domain-containing protein [Clostridia bacterium]